MADSNTEPLPPHGPGESGPRPRPWWSYPTPWVVLGAGLVLAGAGAWALDARIRSATDERFRTLVTQQEMQLAGRLHAYIQILRGAQGLFDSSVDVSRDEWRRYARDLALDENFPGIQGVGYAAVVPAGDVGALQRRVREEGAAAEPSLRHWFEGFTVQPQGPRDSYTTVLYLEPFAGRNLRAFGFDMFSEPVRRAAMERARDTGQPALSGRVQLIQETGDDVQPGFLVYLPVYRGGDPGSIEERRRRLMGWVYSPFRAHDFVRNALPHRGLYVQYAIYDGESTRDEDLLFRTGASDTSTGPVHLSRLALAGHTWTATSRPGPELNTIASRSLAVTAGAGGALIAALIAGLLLAWARTRDAAQALALRMTANLRQRELDVERMAAQLRQSNDDLQQFAYAASHDLKEPLRSIASSLGLLARRQSGLDDRAKEFLDYANDGAQRLSGLIDNLLDYSRVHMLASPRQVVDLEEGLATALRDLDTLIRDSGARITHERLPRVLGDRAQLIRVLQNLIDNAIKYSRRHAAVPEVHVTARSDGTHWVIGVTDNGIGIAPHHHDQIFVMFKRLHTRQEYEGNGMGLALCKRIVQRHGGRMWLRSQPGEGATFYFSLPAAPVEAGAAREPAEGVAP